MFAIENYSVQETRRQARLEGKLEGETIGIAKGKVEDTMNMIAVLQLPVSRAMRITRLPDGCREHVLAELSRQNIQYALLIGFGDGN